MRRLLWGSVGHFLSVIEPLVWALLRACMRRLLWGSVGHFLSVIEPLCKWRVLFKGTRSLLRPKWSPAGARV